MQPSFLGTDNSFMLAAIAASGGRLRGIAVVDPAVTDGELDALAAGGVVGIRYNLIGEDPARIARPDHVGLSRRVAGRGWQIELHVDGRDLPPLLDLLLPLGTPVVVDHFGRPDAALGRDDPGLRRLLAGSARHEPVRQNVRLLPQRRSRRRLRAGAAGRAGAATPVVGLGLALHPVRGPASLRRRHRRTRRLVQPGGAGAIAAASRKLFGCV